MTLDFLEDDVEKLLRFMAQEAYLRSKRCRKAKDATQFMEVAMTCLVASAGGDEDDGSDVCAVGFQYYGEDE